MASFSAGHIDIPGCCRRDSARWCDSSTGGILGDLRMEARADEALRLFRVGPQTPRPLFAMALSLLRQATALPSLSAAGSAGRGGRPGRSDWRLARHLAAPVVSAQ